MQLFRRLAHQESLITAFHPLAAFKKKCSFRKIKDKLNDIDNQIYRIRSAEQDALDQACTAGPSAADRHWRVCMEREDKAER
jgi:hypothetical protein